MLKPTKVEENPQLEDACFVYSNLNDTCNKFENPCAFLYKLCAPQCAYHIQIGKCANSKTQMLQLKNILLFIPQEKQTPPRCKAMLNKRGFTSIKRGYPGLEKHGYFDQKQRHSCSWVSSGITAQLQK